MAVERLGTVMPLEESVVSTQSDVESLDQTLFILDLLTKSSIISTAAGIAASSVGFTMLNKEIGNEQVMALTAFGGSILMSVGSVGLRMFSDDLRRTLRRVEQLGLTTRNTLLSRKVEAVNYQPELITD